MGGIAIFDFDGTIVAGDTGFAFIRRLYRNPLRIALAVLATPFALLLLASRRTRLAGLSVYVWIATLGRSEAHVRGLCHRFARDYVGRKGNVFRGALEALRRHRTEGLDIAVVSGSFAWIVEAILREVEAGECVVVASTWRRVLGGFVVARHCIGGEKVAMACLAGVPVEGRVVGYGDSVRDIPMLRTCTVRRLVNPSRRTEARFRAAFGPDFEVIRWR